MLIGVDSSPCSLSLRNRSMFNYEMPSKQIGLKKYFCTKIFFSYILFVQSQSCLLESTAAIFRQSAGYVSYSFSSSIPFLLKNSVYILKILVPYAFTNCLLVRTIERGVLSFSGQYYEFSHCNL